MGKTTVLLTIAVLAGAASGRLDWQATTPLPNGSWRHACTGANGFVYFLGGGQGPYDACWYARVDPDGTLGPWTPATALPVALGWLSADATDDHIYTVGGWNTGGLTSAVNYASLDTSGAIATWSPTTRLPRSLYTHGAVIVDSFLYVIGGATGIGAPVIDTVWFARIQPDGTLGSWIVTSKLPQPLRIMGIAVRDSFIYTVGGRAGNVAAADVEYGRIHPDGGILGWNPTTNLPSAIDGNTAAVVGDRIYCYGGLVNNVWSAPLNPDGSVGVWVAEAALPASRWAFDGLAIGDRLYAPGGYAGGAFPQVYFTSLLTGSRELCWSGVTRPGLEVRPNPFRGTARVSTARAQVLDVAGRVVARTTVGIIGRGLAPGVYFVVAEGFEPTPVTLIAN